ncbi:hypothetical protein KQX54_011690 [Cotesia glomerata]|uniref:Uncharacterized protein n=1 Tax=Cotesia glomerata TaxID=32391 RepID=A0AAV7I6Y4_COTGL|nr:hypothetical protein KQX54_011690 [Cotesia glomerata]
MGQKNNEINHNFEDKVRKSDAEITDTEAKDTEENNKEDNFCNNDDIKEVYPDNNMDIEFTSNDEIKKMQPGEKVLFIWKKLKLKYLMDIQREISKNLK